MKTLETLRQALANNQTTSRDIIEECLARIEDKEGEGSRAFIHVDPAAVRSEADAMDRLRNNGAEPSPYAGIPISVKDLFDIQGQKTLAGSRVLADSPPAVKDCAAVARLRTAGFIIIGRTNMTEFAYSGLGLNPHYGTPKNPYDRHSQRIPGGSSSGGAISITDGMAAAALGTDTGGSCRIPAAMSGIVGLKPTAARIPTDGVIPLSTSLDSVGMLAYSTRCCAILDSILSAEEDLSMPAPIDPEEIRFGVVTDYVLDDMDHNVESAFTNALSKLRQKGIEVTDVPFPELYEISTCLTKGGLSAAEAYAWHRSLLEGNMDKYDPRVSARIIRGQEQSAADYIDLLNARCELIKKAETVFSSFDILVFPTVPIIAPLFSELENDDDYARINLLALRNPTVTNILDRCAISIPVQEPETAPVGLMLMGENGADRNLLSVSIAVEAIVRDFSQA